MPATGLSVDALRARVATVLGRGRKALTLESRIRAAVLVLFVYRGGVPALVFGKKTEDVPHHKGQFSFPGGVVQHTDSSVVEAALREAWEEVGLEASLVEVLGLFDDVATAVTNFVITPVMAPNSGAAIQGENPTKPRLVPATTLSTLNGRGRPNRAHR